MTPDTRPAPDSGTISAQNRPGELERIVAATDFSATAEAAVEWATGLAREHGATLHLIHGLTLPAPLPDYVPTDASVTAASDLRNELHDIALEKLDAAAKPAREAGVAVELVVHVGVPSQLITQYAEEIGAGLVVVGTQGLTGFRHLLLGSTAERVVQHAHCPVLTIHPDDRDRQRSIRTILAPTDFSHNASRAARVAQAVLGQRGGPVRVILLHAYHLPVEYTAYGAVPTSIDYMKDTGAEAQEKLDAMAAELSGDGLEVEALAVEGYAPEVIVDQAEELGADLISMGTHGRTGLRHLLLGSTAERVVQHAGCPVLTVRVKDDED